MAARAAGRGREGRRGRTVRVAAPVAATDALAAPAAAHRGARQHWRLGRQRGSSGVQGHGGAGANTIGAKSGSTVEGTVSANRAGYGFLRVEGLKDSVFIPPPEMRGVMHGDRLRVRLSRDASDRWSGAVEQVVERGVERVPRDGRDAGSQRVGDARRTAACNCTALCRSRLEGRRGGDWVIARITRHASPARPRQARVEKRLDPDRPVELATESAIARFDLPTRVLVNGVA